MDLIKKLEHQYLSQMIDIEKEQKLVDIAFESFVSFFIEYFRENNIEYSFQKTDKICIFKLDILGNTLTIDIHNYIYERKRGYFDHKIVFMNNTIEYFKDFVQLLEHEIKKQIHGKHSKS